MLEKCRVGFFQLSGIEVITNASIPVRNGGQTQLWESELEKSTFEISVVFSEHCIFKRKTITVLHTFTALLCHTIPVETMTIIYLAQIRNV